MAMILKWNGSPARTYRLQGRLKNSRHWSQVYESHSSGHEKETAPSSSDWKRESGYSPESAEGKPDKSTTSLRAS